MTSSVGDLIRLFVFGKRLAVPHHETFWINLIELGQRETFPNHSRKLRVLWQRWSCRRQIMRLHEDAPFNWKKWGICEKNRPQNASLLCSFVLFFLHTHFAQLQFCDSLHTAKSVNRVNETNGWMIFLTAVPFIEASVCGFPQTCHCRCQITVYNIICGRVMNCFNGTRQFKFNYVWECDTESDNYEAMFSWGNTKLLQRGCWNTLIAHIILQEAYFVIMLTIAVNITCENVKLVVMCVFEMFFTKWDNELTSRYIWGDEVSFGYACSAGIVCTMKLSLSV